MLGKQDRKSTREIIKELAKNNSMLQDAITNAKDEVISLKEESRVLKEALWRSGEGGAEYRG